MSRKTVGRPSKVDKAAMSEANIWFTLIVIMLLLLLSVGVGAIAKPELIDMIKASIYNLFN